MINEKFYHLIDSYLKGDLSDQDRADFEEYSKNTAFLEELEIQKQLYSIHSEEDSIAFSKTEEGKEMLKVIQSAEDNYFQNRPKNRIYKYISYGIAASIFLAITIYSISFFTTENPSLQNYYAEYVNWEELPSLLEREDESNTLVKGVSAFSNKNYQEAIDSFKVYLKENPNNPQVISYLGASYLESGNDLSAIETFQGLAEMNSVDSSKGYWFIALIHLKNENKKAAITTLKKIASSDKNYNYIKAKEILGKIDP